MRRALGVLLITLSFSSGVLFASPETGSDTNAPPHHRQLTEEQKTQLAERAEAAWSKLTPEAKIRLMRIHQALVEMPPEERQLIHQQIDRFLNMTPAEREQVQKNAKIWNDMTPEQREKARALFRQRRRELEQQNPATNQPPATGDLPPGQ